MLINYILWLIMGLVVGYLGHHFDVNVKKGLQTYLFVGMITGYVAALIIHFLIWPVAEGEVNLVATFLGGLFAYIGVRLIDFFFHL